MYRPLAFPRPPGDGKYFTSKIKQLLESSCSINPGGAPPRARARGINKIQKCTLDNNML